MNYHCKDHLISTSIDEDLVFLDRDSGFYFGLNSVGHCIWRLLQQNLSKSEIVDHLLAEFEVCQRQCEQEVESFLDSLKKNSLIVEAA